jgi:hypothetical protein
MSVLSEAYRDRFGFSLPASFLQFEAGGFFAYPGLDYLVLEDMEWLTAEDVRSFSFLPFQVNTFVPFAVGGGGDLWAWDPKMCPFGEPRIVVCWRDSEDASIYAPTFVAAVYRQLLEICGASVLSLPDLEVRRAKLLALIGILGNLIPPDWRSTLTEIASRQAQSTRSTGRRPEDWYSLVSSEEIDRVFRAHANYDELDKPIQWQRS